MSKLLEIPFINDMGQTINPGEEVLAISSGQGNSLKIRKAVYAGLINGAPSIISDTKKWGYYDTNGKNVGYALGASMRISGKLKPCKRRSNLYLGRIYKLA